VFFALVAAQAGGVTGSGEDEDGEAGEEQDDGSEDEGDEGEEIDDISLGGSVVSGVRQGEVEEDPGDEDGEPEQDRGDGRGAWVDWFAGDQFGQEEDSFATGYPGSRA
jgi:hypothetical protein